MFSILGLLFSSLGLFLRFQGIVCNFRVTVFKYRVIFFGFRVIIFGFRVIIFHFRVVFLFLVTIPSFGLLFSSLGLLFQVSSYHFPLSGYYFRVSGYFYQIMVKLIILTDFIGPARRSPTSPQCRLSYCTLHVAAGHSLTAGIAPSLDTCILLLHVLSFQGSALHGKLCYFLNQCFFIDSIKMPTSRKRSKSSTGWFALW